MRLSPGLFLCTSLACLSLAGCSEERTATPSAVRPVRTIVVEPFKLAVVAEGAGRVRARYDQTTEWLTLRIPKSLAK